MTEPEQPERQSPERPEEQTEAENQQYPEHGRPDAQRRRVGLPDEGGKRRPPAGGDD